MIKISINKIQYTLKNSYDEITFKEYLQLLLNNDSPTPNIDNITLLSGIPKELINELVLDICTPHIEFIEATELFRCSFLDPKISAINVGEESFLKLETAKVILKNNGAKNIIHCANDIVKIYTDFDLNDKLVMEALPIANHFISQLDNFFQAFKKLNEYKPSKEELAAGIRNMDYLGFYSLLDSLTHSDITKREQVKEMPAFEVYNQLLVDFEKAMFQKRLSDKIK
jgi:hypothetical protein